MDTKHIEDILALTPMQEGMLFHYRHEPGNDIYFEQVSLEISGRINRERFEKAWNFVIETNEMLRAVFRWEKVEKPVQIILNEHKLRLKYFDFSRNEYSQPDKENKDKKDNKRIKRLEEIRVNDRKETFDLREVPFRVTLVKLEKARYVMLISNHHILYDGWSNGIILSEFFSAYNDLVHGKMPGKPAKCHFNSFLKWLQDQELERQENEWRTYLEGFETPPGLPVKQKQPGEKENRNPGNLMITISKDIGLQLERLIQRYKYTMAVLLYGAWGLLLQKYNDCDDVIFGTTVSGRPPQLENIENTVGLFINTVPLRIKTRPREKAIDFFKRINKSLQKRQAVESTSLVKIKEYSQLSYNQTEALFDTIVVIENYPLDERLRKFKGELSVNRYSAYERPHYDLTIVISLPGEPCVPGVPGEITVNFIYKNELFPHETIERLTRHFSIILSDIAKNHQKEINRLDILSVEEKRRLLIDFNATAADYPGDKTICQLFTGQVAQTPDHIALHGCLETKPHRRGHITYRELNQKSECLASFLKEKGVTPDTVVGIMTERSAAMITGIFGILKAGAAYLPIDPDYPGERIQYILNDSGAKLLVTTPTLAEKVKNTGSPEMKNNFDFLFIDTFEFSVSSSSHLLNFSSSASSSPLPANLAYVIYTSGSTGKPKGVMIEHRSLVNRINWMQKRYPIGKGDVILQKTPVVFDVSVWELFWWSNQGASLSLLAPGEEKDPAAVAEAIENEQVTTMHFVPSMLKVFLEYLETSDQGKLVKLASLKQVFASGEALLTHHVERFNRLLNHTMGTRLINLYGPTEATVDVSYYDCPKQEHRETIPIGRPIDNICLFVVDRFMCSQPVGVPGQLCIAGIGLARGYLNRPGLTFEKFVNYKLQITNTNNGAGKVYNKKFLRGSRGQFLQKEPPGRRRQSIYRTGDLACWLPDGNIEFLGRLDHQVKIRGFRIELGEIENQLLNHTDIQDAVIIVNKDRDNENYLCAYIVSGAEHPLTVTELQDHLSRALPGHMVPSYFVRLDRIPLAINGKIDRKALPEPEITAEQEYIPPGNDIEKKLAQLWAEVLGVPGNRIGINSNFFRLGGHSLKAARLLSLVHREFNVNLPLADLLSGPTIGKLAGNLTGREKETFVALEPVKEKKYYCLSSAQRRLFILQQMSPGTIAYNLASVVLLEGECDLIRLTGSFRQLITRHESLRTSFELMEGEPVQKIHPEVEFSIETISSPSPTYLEPGTGNEKKFIRPFDLSRAPLFRVGLIKEEDNKDVKKYIMVIDMHHIIYDGISQDIFFKEFKTFYAGKELPRLKLQYKDYAQWQNRQLEAPSLAKQARYWTDCFKNRIPLLDLPHDYARPAVRSFSGASIDFEINKQETRALTTIATEQGSTLFMVLLSIYVVFLSRISSQEDIVVGTPAAVREHPDLQPVIGNFLNTLVLRTYPVQDKPFNSFLREVKNITLKAFANKDFPFELLVERAAAARDLSRNPLFDVMLILHNQWDSPPMKTPGQPVKGLSIKPYPYERNTSEFDLVLDGFAGHDRIYFRFQYSTKLFKAETIGRFIDYFKNILSSILKQPENTIGEIEILSPQEKRLLLQDFNNTTAADPTGKTIHEAFAEQVEKTAGRIALTGSTVHDRTGLNTLPAAAVSLTYSELNKKSNRLAYILKEKGIAAGSIVGIKIERSLEMMTGILGILKAGAAYLPIDPEYPEERRKYMLADSGVKVVVTSGSPAKEATPNIENISIETFEVLNLPSSQFLNFSSSQLLAFPSYHSSNLAYLIYTSGSTGKPRGVMIEHRSVINFIKGITDVIPFKEEDTILSLTTISFDIFGLETILPLTRGSKVIIGSKEEQLNTAASAGIVEREQVTIFQVTPSRLQLIVSGQEASRLLGVLNYLLVGGEVFPAALSETVKSLVKGNIYNLYGPTETTIWSTIKNLTGKMALNIGKPLANTRVYILSQQDQLQPLNVAGQLCITGAGVSRGYINRPELTAEKFILATKSQSHKDVYFSLCPGALVAKLYKTGDLAQWLPDGNIEFLGRLDHQVKIRGYRIELGEIENQLLSREAIKDAVVTVKEENDSAYLYAYIAAVPGQEIDVSRLRTGLGKQLPDYMIPSYFVLLETIPLTPNGKIDRKALDTYSPNLAMELEYVPPENQAERAIAGIWQEVLRLDKVGLHHNFFDLGGNSMDMIRVNQRLKEDLNIDIPIVLLFRFTTIGSLGQYISEGKTREVFLQKSLQKAIDKGKNKLKNLRKKMVNV